jgi:hypothetical protein
MVHMTLQALGVGLVLATLRAALQFARMSAGRGYAREQGRRILTVRRRGPADL